MLQRVRARPNQWRPLRRNRHQETPADARVRGHVRPAIHDVAKSRDSGRLTRDCLPEIKRPQLKSPGATPRGDCVLAGGPLSTIRPASRAGGGGYPGRTARSWGWPYTNRGPGIPSVAGVIIACRAASMWSSSETTPKSAGPSRRTCTRTAT